MKLCPIYVPTITSLKSITLLEYIKRQAHNTVMLGDTSIVLSAKDITAT